MEPGSQPVLFRGVWPGSLCHAPCEEVVRAGEAAKTVKHLPCVHQVLESILRTTSHTLDMVDQIYNPNTCGGRRIRKLNTILPYIENLRASWATHLKKKKSLVIQVVPYKV